MTIDGLINDLKYVVNRSQTSDICLDSCDAEQLLYWLTEYRAMTSNRQSDSLSERLAEHLVWAESNSYECPITLEEDLQEAISTIAKAKRQMHISNEMIVERDCIIDGMEAEINRLRSESSWIPCSEKMPFEPGVHVLVTDGRHIMESWYEVTDGVKLWVDNYTMYVNISFGDVTHWMPIPNLPKEVSND